PETGLAGTELPETELVCRRVPVDRDRLAGYARVCGYPVSDLLPPAYPQVLAFPLMLMLLTAPEFPFPAAGVVHLANRITVHRPLTAGELLDLSVHAERLRPHPRGRQVDLVAVATVAGAEVWRGESSYLHRSRGAGGGGHRTDGEPPPPTAVWRVGADLGRSYAAVSGDWNPIHTSALAARAFGFRRRIAHGMWTKARCLAQLTARLPPSYTVEVEFRAPILLPATVGFSGDPAGFAVHDRRSGRPHLSGSVITVDGLEA
ncbi:MAG: MaoC family dehydratase, partial [Natronosporangium sp.]